MKIACLGWGSLVWKPDYLPIVGEWQRNGPALPVEFSRQSRDGRVTLVLTEGVMPVTVLWSELRARSLEDAREMLRVREGVPKSRMTLSIGSCTTATVSTDETTRGIIDWAALVKLDGVVWTALPPKFGDKAITPSSDQVLAYLSSLVGEPRRCAEEYVRRAPAQIATAYRQRIECELGWTPAT